MAKIYYENSIDDKLLKSKKIAVIGYGSQGHAHALNLKDSGYDVLVGLHEGSESRKLAEEKGLSVYSVSEACAKSDFITILIPDTKHGKVYEASIKPNLNAGDTILVGHGFSIFYRTVTPSESVNAIMVAPKGPGHILRSTYQNGIGIPALFAIHQDATGESEQLVLAYAKGIGCARAGVLRTTFKEETETDLFGEQAVLCGGVAELMRNGFETLVEAGYQPEVAYFETVHELKLIIDLIHEGGLKYMNFSVSDTAEYGGYTRGSVVVDGTTKDKMRKVLQQVQSGQFAKEWLAETEEGYHWLTNRRETWAAHQMEKVGRQIREMIPWLKKDKR